MLPRICQENVIAHRCDLLEPLCTLKPNPCCAVHEAGTALQGSFPGPGKGWGGPQDDTKVSVVVFETCCRSLLILTNLSFQSDWSTYCHSCRENPAQCLTAPCRHPAGVPRPKTSL